MMMMMTMIMIFTLDEDGREILSATRRIDGMIVAWPTLLCNVDAVRLFNQEPVTRRQHSHRRLRCSRYAVVTQAFARITKVHWGGVCSLVSGSR